MFTKNFISLGNGLPAQLELRNGRVFAKVVNMLICEFFFYFTQCILYSDKHRANCANVCLVTILRYLFPLFTFHPVTYVTSSRFLKQGMFSIAGCYHLLDYSCWESNMRQWGSNERAFSWKKLFRAQNIRFPEQTDSKPFTSFFLTFN